VRRLLLLLVAVVEFIGVTFRRAPVVGEDLVTRFCGGPVEPESSVFAPNGEIVGCTVAFACCSLSVTCPRRPM
jgi:hypothetical protein